jgi:hypothetical protein
MSPRPVLLAIFFASLLFPALAEDKTVAFRPDGTGDPDGTTCRPPQPLPRSRFLGPQVCKLNSQWALLRKNGQDISADGSQIIPDPKGTNIAPGQCTTSGGGATGGGMPVCH